MKPADRARLAAPGTGRLAPDAVSRALLSAPASARGPADGNHTLPMSPTASSIARDVRDGPVRAAASGPLAEASGRRAAAAPGASAALWLCRAWAIAWYAYLLVAPTLGVAWIDSWHNEQRMLEVLLLALGVPVLAAAALAPSWRRGLPGLHWTVPAVFFLGALSAWRAPLADAAWAEVALHLLLVVLIVVAAATVAADGARAGRLARRGALLLLGVYAAGVAVRYAAALAISQPLNLDVLLLGYNNPRFPSALHALLLPFVAALALDAREGRWLRRLAGVVLALTWAINIALGTRAIWFAYVISLGLLYATLGRSRLRPLAGVLLWSAAAGIVLYFLFFKFLPIWTGIGETFTERTLDKLTWGTNRELLIASSWQAIRAAPWLGLGPMQFAALPQVWAAHPHNWLLQLASEWGLPATALALVGLAALARRARAAARAAAGCQGDLLAPLTAALVALVYGQVDGNLVMPVSQAAAALVFGLLLGALPPRDGAGPPTPRPLRIGGAALLLTGAILAAAATQLVWFSATTVAAATAQEGPQSIFPTRALWPRFWSDGLLPLKKE
jgi:O-antigen ligase